MKSKYLVGVFLFIFWAITTALITAGLLASQNSAKTNCLSGILSGSGTTTPIALTAAVVASHNTANDCWMIISGKVYDFTSLVATHSGGGAAIIRSCGKDGTTDFATKDRNPAQSHSGFAQSILSSYYLGDLGAQVNVSAQVQQINSTPHPRSREDD